MLALGLGLILPARAQDKPAADGLAGVDGQAGVDGLAGVAIRNTGHIGTIVNTGTIAGGTTAIDSRGGTIGGLRNSGTIRGAVRMGDKPPSSGQ